VAFLLYLGFDTLICILDLFFRCNSSFFVLLGLFFWLELGAFGQIWVNIGGLFWFFGLWVSCRSGCCGCCIPVLGLVLMSLFGFFFLWVSFGCSCVYFRCTYGRLTLIYKVFLLIKKN